MRASLPRRGGFSSGWYRPNKPGTVAIPADATPIDHSGEQAHAPDGRLRHPHTAENMAAINGALSLRKFSWEDGE